MRLTSITVGNFMNLAETTLDLTKMVAVVSTNNYGKSNLLNAIRFGFDFIEASAKVRTNMMHWIRGIPLVPCLAGKDFIFSVEIDAPELGKYRFIKYSFSFSWINDENTGGVITDETIDMRANESVRYTSYLKRNRGQYRAGKDKTSYRNITLAKDVLAVDILSAIDDIDISDAISSIKSLGYRMCQTLELDRSFQFSPIEFDFDTSSALSFDDSDIPKALNTLRREKPDQFDLFIETIYDLFPEFEDIDLRAYTLKNEGISGDIRTVVISSDGNEEKSDELAAIPYHIKDEIYRLIIRSKVLNQPISMELMSTGTKRIIWLVANALFGNCYGINLIGVDEVETSIHPKMIRSLLEALNGILENASMIVTSHSPYLIQYLKPESIYVGVPNEKGLAQFKRIQKSKIKVLVSVARDLGTSVGEYLFELMAGDDDSAAILSAYLED